MFIGSPDTTPIRKIYQNYMTEYNFEYESEYGDGEKFNHDWTYTKSYGGPHLDGDKLLVYNMKKSHLKLDTYFSQLNLKTPTLMYHFCQGDFGKSQKSGFLFIKFSTRFFLLRIF